MGKGRGPRRLCRPLAFIPAAPPQTLGLRTCHIKRPTGARPRVPARGHVPPSRWRTWPACRVIHERRCWKPTDCSGDAMLERPVLFLADSRKARCPQRCSALPLWGRPQIVPIQSRLKTYFEALLHSFQKPARPALDKSDRFSGPQFPGLLNGCLAPGGAERLQPRCRGGRAQRPPCLLWEGHWVTSGL